MFPTLIKEIKDILEDISEVAKVYPYPATKIDEYPAVIFYPAGFENGFESTQENNKIYNFNLFVVVNANQNTFGKIFETILSETVQKVLDEFDEKWSSTIGSHRASYLINSGDWGIVNNENGVECVAELNLRIKLLTNN
jgi:hypothetical protein